MRRPWRLKAAALCAVLYMAFFATYLATRPSYDWDTIAYMAVALHMEGVPNDRLHDETYGLIRAALPQAWVDNLTGNLTPDAVAVAHATTTMGNIDLRQDWAAHSESFLAQLPFFSVKPLYPALMAVGNVFGVSLITSGLVISAIAYFLIGMLFFVWFAECMPPFIALGTAALLILNPWLVVLARSVGTDIFSIAFLLFGAYFAIRDRPMLSASIFALSILARPENSVYAGMFLLYLGVTRKLTVLQTLGFLIATFAFYAGVSQFGANYGWKTLFYFVFINRNAVPGTPIPTIGMWDILMVYVSRLDRILLGQGELPVFVLIAYGALCLKIHRLRYAYRDAMVDPYIHLIILSALISVARMLLVPSEAFRALLPCYMLVTVALVNACAQLRMRTETV